MLRLSRLADYAVAVLVRLSRAGGCQTAPGLAAAAGLPEPTVAKVLKMLAGAGLVTSTRGARGGYSLARALDAVSVADVIAAIDGPVALTACVEGAAVACEAGASCPVHGGWDPVNRAVVEALGRISLAEIGTRPPVPAAASRSPSTAACAAE